MKRLVIGNLQRRLWPSVVLGCSSLIPGNHVFVLPTPACHHTATSEARRTFLHQSRPLHRKPNFTLNMTNPEQGLIDVREKILQLTQEGRLHTSQHYHALINMAMCHYVMEEFAMARDLAIQAHDTIVRNKGPRHSLVYFSATTCSQCCKALADELEAHVEQDVAVDTLKASASKALESPRFIAKLRDEEERFAGIAYRVKWLPEHFYGRTEEENQTKHWQETDSSTAYTREARNATKTEAKRRKERRKRHAYQEHRRVRKNNGEQVPR